MSARQKVLIVEPNGGQGESLLWLREWSQVAVSALKGAGGWRGLVFTSDLGGAVVDSKSAGLKIQMHGYSTDSVDLAVVGIVLDQLVNDRRQDDMVLINAELLTEIDKHNKKLLEKLKKETAEENLSHLALLKDTRVWDFSLDKYCSPLMPMAPMVNVRAKREEAQRVVEPELGSARKGPSA